MTDTLISVDLSESPHTNENIHNRCYPDISINIWIEPGDDFRIGTYGWTGGQINNNDAASDVAMSNWNRFTICPGRSA